MATAETNDEMRVVKGPGIWDLVSGLVESRMGKRVTFDLEAPNGALGILTARILGLKAVPSGSSGTEPMRAHDKKQQEWIVECDSEPGWTGSKKPFFRLRYSTRTRHGKILRTPEGKETKVATITFIRHGNAEKWSGKVEEDHDRPLSEKGIAQAEERRSKLGNPTFDLIISSSATRCVSTARIIAGEENPPEMIILSKLYLPKDPVLWKTFERIGYAPLREWMSQENDPDGVLPRYGKDAWKLITPVISTTDAKVLVAGHAPLLSAIGVQCRPRHNTELLYDVQFDECEGFVITDDEISLIQG